MLKRRTRDQNLTTNCPWLLLLAVAVVAALGSAGCSEDEDAPAKLGEACQADRGDDACENEEASCTANEEGNNECQVVVGGSCDLESDDAHCAVGLDCFGYPDPETPDDPEARIGKCATVEGGECDPLAPTCAPDLLCAEKVDGSYACHEPVVLRGLVRDSASSAAIEGAHVIALDKNKVAVTDVAVTDAEGDYVLTVPVVRNDDGSPVTDTAFTLRATAADYQPFPFGIRTAIPILSSEAVRESGETEESFGRWVIEGTLTEVELIALPDDGVARVSISGSVVTRDDDGDGVDDNGAGVLVVAHGGGEPAPTAISDLGGHYTIFNVAPGSVEVRGYKAGLQLMPVAVSVGGEALEDVDLVPSGTGPATVSGSVNIVNAFGGAQTSVVLAVEDTFQDTFGRGEVPSGLRTPLDVTGAWSIEGVPAGNYVVLAAFENDRLVRDPDQNIAGTATVRINVAAGEDQTLSEAFKVTEALEVIEPGANLPTPVTSAPVLTWADDSSEEYYTVEVFNALGELVFEDMMVPGVSGSEQVTLPYGGPLEPGMYYQFRALSWRAPGGGSPSPISATEDLRGVFFVE